ncbi:AraC family transcriptional regulator [Methylobacterium sp. ID0610]|uniref:AraC family transcriptional regulator n=1 Tax=Methylobacterium carpenticola TaxID=3344827 RepID=UPI0036AA2610
MHRRFLPENRRPLLRNLPSSVLAGGTMLASPSPNLEKLYAHCIFHSTTRMEAHARISEELCDHHLRWHDSGIDTRFYKLSATHLSLYSLRYGAEVEIFPDIYRDFSLVHFSLRQPVEIEADGYRRTVEQGRAIVSSPSRNINLHWSRNSEQLILRLPHQLLDEAAGRMGRPRLSEAIRRMPGLLLPETGSRQWQSQLQTFALLERQARDSEALQPWLAHLEQGMAMFLLLQADGGIRAEVSGEEARPHDGGPARRRLDRLHDFARANMTRPVTLDDLSRAAALSRRQLNVLCQEHLGMPPMVWLRGLRLDSVRATLLADAQSDLAGVAMLHGFYHLGRFSAYYRARFGELPSETRRRARSG